MRKQRRGWNVESKLGAKRICYLGAALTLVIFLLISSLSVMAKPAANETQSSDSSDGLVLMRTTTPRILIPDQSIAIPIRPPIRITRHAPIHIVGDADFTYANGVRGGRGTAENPYFITGWTIDASAYGGSSYGIWVQGTTAYFAIVGCVINNTTIDGEVSGAGILLERVQNVEIRKNICINNEENGIELLESSNNTICGNICKNNSVCGICLNPSSDNNIVSKNVCANNGVAGPEVWFGRGIMLDNSSNNIIENNTCENNGTANIGLHNSSHNNIVENNTCENNAFHGIELWNGSGFNTITNNTCRNNKGNGIYLSWYCCINIIKNNICENSEFCGIILGYFSNQNRIENNSCKNNGDGIELYHQCMYNTLNNNTCANNEKGIRLFQSDSNILDNDTCLNNSLYGICLESSSNNGISHNVCRRNSTAIYLTYSNGNIIYRNRLSDVRNAYDDGTNDWDHDRYGNWWSDWRPPTHSDSDGDGIIDDPRPIDGGSNVDYYPLDW